MLRLLTRQQWQRNGTAFHAFVAGWLLLCCCACLLVWLVCQLCSVVSDLELPRVFHASLTCHLWPCLCLSCCSSSSGAATTGGSQPAGRLEVGVWKTVEAHSKGQVTALAAHPNAPLLATATNNQV
jgi:hypothetical protein